MISFCTTVSNRLFQLEQTIGSNLALTKVGEVELCVLAYNDPTILPYLTDRYGDYIADKRLVVKEHFENRVFSCGYVKNLSHAMGRGEILFNLDADNYIGNALSYLVDLKEDEVIKNFMYINDGRSGRIGVYRSLFNKVGGYRDVGRADDGEFVLRCVLAGAKLKHMDCDIAPISNFR
jgi:hypothetical protein